MESTVRTVLGSYLQTCMFTDLPFEMKQFTTLNERFGVQAGVAPAVGQIPALGYFGVGNGGHRAAIGTDSIPLTTPVQHSGADAGLYKPLPLILREETNDLEPSERARYGIRRAEEHNGRRYYAYYLRRIDKTNVRPVMEQVVVEDNGQTTTVTQFVPTSANLNPVPPVLDPNGVNSVDGTYLQVTARMSLSLSAWEVAELINVSMVLFNDERYAVISEICLVTGIDKTVQSPGIGSSTISHNEVICAQIASHISALYPLNFSSQGVDIVVDLGTQEPLYLLTNA